MRVLVTGARGMLAHALLPTLRERGHEVVALDREALDVTDAAAVEARIAAERPDAVVQCAAYTRVDDAETDEARAFAVNCEGARNVARSCYRTGALFVYPSTDYVFSGEEERARRPSDPTGPVNAYGRSKLAGEEAAREAGRSLVLRTSWLYGEGGANFVDTITRLARERECLEVVDDQFGLPTWTGSLALVATELMEAGAEGILHAADAGDRVTWCGFARETLARQGLATRIVPVPSSRFPRPARRPRYSVLDCSDTEARLGRALPRWTDALDQFLLRR